MPLSFQRGQFRPTQTAVDEFNRDALAQGEELTTMDEMEYSNIAGAVLDGKLPVVGWEAVCSSKAIEEQARDSMQAQLVVMRLLKGTLRLS